MAREILDEAEQSYVVDSPEHCSDPEKMDRFLFPGEAVEESNK
jgi:hypothetical protein